MTINDKQKVLALFNQDDFSFAPTINRRTFCTFTSLSFISLLLPACTDSGNNTSLKILIQEPEFGRLFGVIFPVTDIGLKDYRNTTLSRIQRLSGKNAVVVMQIYKLFKARLWLKRDLGTKDYSKAMGEKCLIDLLHSKYADQCNQALDTIYYELSKDNKLITALWGRNFSLTDRKCVYWDNYDQAIS